MMLPTIHLNGTPASRLRDQACEAGEAIRKALDALSRAAPHGRDYYPQEGNAYEKARAEHDERLEKLRSVGRDMIALVEHVAPYCKD